MLALLLLPRVVSLAQLKLRADFLDAATPREPRVLRVKILFKHWLHKILKVS